MFKITLIILAYGLLFCTFEYINAKHMINGSWNSFVAYAFKPHIFLFFALSPILIWGFNKEIYEHLGNRFWYTGICLNVIEFASYLLGSLLLYREFPTVRECIGFGLILLALLIAYDPTNK